MLITLAVLAATAPHASAQTTRPEPRELWQQFPLEEAGPRTQAPQPAPDPAPAPAPVPANPTSADDGGDGSFWSAPVVAIAATMGVLIVLMLGLLAYLTRAQLALGRAGAGRRFQRAAAQESLSRRLADVRRIADTVRERAVPASTPTELARVKALLAAFVARGPAQRRADEQVRKLKAKLDARPATEGKDLRNPDVEILKAKRARPAGSPDGPRPDEAEAELLKAKLAAKTRARKPATGTVSKQEVSN